MGENQKTQKPSIIDNIKSTCKGIKIEFKKIIWPSKEELGKQTAVVIVLSTILTFIIAIIDMLVKYGMGFLVK